MFRQVKSAIFWYYLYKFRRRAIFVFFLLLVAFFSGMIYGDIVEYLKLSQKIEYIKYVLFTKWFVIVFNISLSAYLVLTLFKDSKKEKEDEKIEIKKEKKAPKEEFSAREKELLHKKTLTTKAESIIKK